MLEYRLEGSLYSSLNNGKGLIAEGQAEKGPIEYIKSGLFKDLTTYVIVTHIMTRWHGRVDDERRNLARSPFRLGPVTFPCESANFSVDGMDCALNLQETNVRGFEDYIHQSDVICTALEGRFTAAGIDDFQRRIEKHRELSNVLYTRFYNGEAPRVLLKFRETPTNTFDYICVMNNHSSGQDIRETATTVTERKGPVYYGREFRPVKWDDIGGLFEPKEQIRNFLRRFLNPEVCRCLGGRPQERGGVFLIGPAGTGKTLIGEATATELAEVYEGDFAPFFLDMSDFTSIYRGGASIRTAKVFEGIRAMLHKVKAGMLFLDENQQTAQRHSGEHIHCNEVLDQTLIETSRFPYGKCLVMAATARDPFELDQQLLRPGRFGTHIFFENPNLDERIEILQKAINKRVERSAEEQNRTNYGIETLVGGSLDYPRIAEQTDNFSLAEVYHLVGGVFDKKEDEILSGGSFSPIRTEDFEEPIKNRRVAKSKTMSRKAVI